jgi:putative peptidoglycan lipid II flippase
MTGSVLLSRILGYVRDAVVAAKHGASATTDVYFASFTLPDLMSYMLAGGALSITFLPMFSKYLHSDREDEGWECFSVIATTVGSILAAMTVIVWIAAPVLIPPLLPGFSPAQLDETISLTRIVLPAQIFFWMGGLLGGTVLARQRFREAALAPLVYNACIILFGVALSDRIGIAGFSWGALIGAALGPFGLMLWAARRRGLKYRPRFSLTHPDLRRFVLLSLPVMLGFSLVTVDEWIGRYFASGMPDGSISWLQNARRLMLVPVSVLGQAAGQATLPFLAKLHAEGKDEEAASMLIDALRVVAFATLAASAWMFITAEPLIGLFFERGEYTSGDTAATASALIFLSLGIVFWAAQALVARGFYALQDTWTPMLISTVIALLSVPVYWWLGQELEHRGLAIATTLGMLFTSVATLLALRRRLPLPLRSLAQSVARSALVATLAGAAGYLAHTTVSTSDYLLRISVTSAVFGITYLSLVTALKVPEWTTFASRVRRRLGK